MTNYAWPPQPTGSGWLDRDAHGLRNVWPPGAGLCWEAAAVPAALPAPASAVAAAGFAASSTTAAERASVEPLGGADSAHAAAVAALASQCATIPGMVNTSITRLHQDWLTLQFMNAGC